MRFSLPVIRPDSVRSGKFTTLMAENSDKFTTLKPVKVVLVIEHLSKIGINIDEPFIGFEETSIYWLVQFFSVFHWSSYKK